MKQHFVTFYSPGTFVAEQTTKKIDSWDVETAISMAKEIKERYNALPYGFQFTTRDRGENDLDSHETESSPFYYLGGKVYTIKELKKIGNPADSILISNMECNKWEKVIVSTNSWKWTQPLKDTDIVLSMEVN